jgi:hypothetical protein
MSYTKKENFLSYPQVNNIGATVSLSLPFPEVESQRRSETLDILALTGRLYRALKPVRL